MKNNKTLIYSVLLLFIFIKVEAQQTVKYNGPFNNGLGIPATATYSYYVNTATKKQVKHGNFRYSVREKDQNSRYSQSISGNYEHGLKNGQWEYQINIKDYKKSTEEYYQTSDIHLIANYSKGIPDGLWIYSATLSKRGKYKAGKEERWDAAIPVKNISIAISFKNGKLVDSLIINDEMGSSYTFLMNEKGLLDGYCKFAQNVQNTIVEYVNGFEKSRRINDGAEIQNPYFIQFQNFTNKKNSNVSLDTLSYFKQSDFSIASILNENIFNDSYFLYEKIDGDKLLFDENEKLKPYEFSGLYFLNIKNTFNSTEVQYIQKINLINRDIEEKLNKCRLEIKRAKDKIELQKTEAKLQILADDSKRLICYTSQIQSIVLLDQAIGKAITQCGDLKLDSKGLSRESYLLKLYNKAAELKNQLNLYKI